LGYAFDNRLFLVGDIVSLDPVRYSPAGIPIARAVIRHESRHAGQKMQCELVVAAQAELATSLGSLAPGRRIRVSGPVTQAGPNSRNVLMWIEHLTEE
jgi:primosomal replication protein N